MAKSIAGNAGKALQIKLIRHAVFIGLVPAVCVAMAILQSRGTLNTIEAPGSYFFAVSQFAATTPGTISLILFVVAALACVAMKRYTVACYGLSLAWVVYFLRSLQ